MTIGKTQLEETTAAGIKAEHDRLERNGLRITRDRTRDFLSALISQGGSTHRLFSGGIPASPDQIATAAKAFGDAESILAKFDAAHLSN